MGCYSSRNAAIEELNQLIIQVCLENSQLEKERDKLKSQHDERIEEKKDSLQDLRAMHNDLESEIKELKEIMQVFIPTPESENGVEVSIKKGIQRIIEVQKDLEEKSEKIREMIVKREELKKENETLESLIIETEKQVSELDYAIELQEETLKDQGNLDDKIQDTEREKFFLMEELREAENLYKSLANEAKTWEDDEISSKSPYGGYH